MAAQDNHNKGLVIFMRKFPAQVNSGLLESKLRPFLLKAGIGQDAFELHKTKNRGTANLFIEDKAKGELFLDQMKKKPSNLGIGRHPIDFELNGSQDGGFAIRDGKFIEQQEREIMRAVNQNSRLEPRLASLSLTGNEHPQQHSQSQTQQRTFNFRALSCGSWGYADGKCVFLTEYEFPGGQGKVMAGTRSIVVLIFGSSEPKEWQWRLDFPFDSTQVCTSNGPVSSVIISREYAPRMYRRNSTALLAHRDLQIARMLKLDNRSKIRIPSIDQAHFAVAGTCLSYRIELDSPRALRSFQAVIEHVPEGPRVERYYTCSIRPGITMERGLTILERQLQDSKLPFSVRFQATRLATSGYLPPGHVANLIPTLQRQMASGTPEEHCSNALRELTKSVPYAGPQTRADEFSIRAIKGTLITLLEQPYHKRHSRDTVGDNGTVALVHRVRITPSGQYLEGPDPEVTNRVLRKYSEHIDSFMRVAFTDEDGEPLRHSFDVSNDDLYAHFNRILDGSLYLVNRSWRFLGFSQSSLRSQTAWFMAPFVAKAGQMPLTPAAAIEDIGDFSQFRSPARCAARIGQAFTDTNGYVRVKAHLVNTIPDVTRNGRVFSDGCGVIAEDLAYEIGSFYPRFSFKEKPNVFQIRFRGAKGVVSVQSNLPGGQLMLRPSMVKFSTENEESHDLEICGMADKARPFFLNRNLIKVLEDLGVPPGSFLQLAKETFDRLQGATTNYMKAAKLLDDEQVGTYAGLPGLIRRMHALGIHSADDRMLCAVVELSALVKLRSMKYKGRMLVKDGVKLMGIMDETGYLNEGQIHVAYINAKGQRIVKLGKVAITRSPCNHPGDVQLAKAVDVPAGSILGNLYNCVIFSQFGDRDLPSKLGGGDLDGDLYDVFWDPRIMPPKLFMPANYPRANPVDIQREIRSEDITKHFIDFMRNDQIGILANQLLVLSDRCERGTQDPVCIAISELMSTALDYPKTGIVANIRSLPRFDKTWKPDFMAPGPKVRIEDVNPFAAGVANEIPEDPDDPVSALDPDERKIRYYNSPHVLGRIYRLVDEKGFYEQLQKQTEYRHRNNSALKRVLALVERAIVGFEYRHQLAEARHIRDSYETNVENMCFEYALHSAHPLHEIEVITGTVLGSIFSRKLRERAIAMKGKYGEDVTYVKNWMRCRVESEDDVHASTGDDIEGLMRAVACLSVGVREPRIRTGLKGKGGAEMHAWSFAYVAAAVCLEELEKFQGGRLKAL